MIVFELLECFPTTGSLFIAIKNGQLVIECRGKEERSTSDVPFLSMSSSMQLLISLQMNNNVPLFAVQDYFKL